MVLYKMSGADGPVALAKQARLEAQAVGDGRPGVTRRGVPDRKNVKRAAET